MKNQKNNIDIYKSIKIAIFRGWEITSSSDGYAKYGNGNILSSNNSGPNGFGNPSAWFVLSKVINNQQYQFCVQTDGYMGFRIKYSKLGFNNNLSSLDNTPEATDQQILLGEGTDTAPIYQQIISGSIQFGISNVNISVTTSTNILNFILKPIVPPPVITRITNTPKIIVNTILK